MASDAETNNTENESVPQVGHTIVSKEEKQVEGYDGLRDTRKRKIDINHNFPNDGEEKSENKKRRLDNGKKSDDEKCDVDNEPSQKSKKSKKNPWKTISAPEEPTTTPSAAAQNSLLPTVEEVCSAFGLNDVKIQYRDVDYQNLTNYKFFTKHVRPILAKENPKVSVVNVMMLVAAKWREFSSEKSFIELAPPPPPPPPTVSKKKKVMPTVDEVCAAFGLKDVKIDYNEADDVDLTKYTSFAAHVRNVLRQNNPKAPFGKLSMLVSAKWREFTSQKAGSTEQATPAPPPQSAADPSKEERPPTVREVCATFGLKDVEIQYRKIDHENLTDLKSFSRYVRPILSKENPKVPASKMALLVAAKWREFSSQKLVFTEPTPPPSPTSPAADPKKEELPTVQEVCAAYGLEDVKIEYDDFGVESLSNYRSFTQHVRPILSIENPKVPASKILMLVAAKWREFSSQKNTLDEETESDENKENESQNSVPKPTRSQATKRKAQINDTNDADEEKIENRVTRARSGQNKKNTRRLKNVSAGPQV